MWFSSPKACIITLMLSGFAMAPPPPAARAEELQVVPSAAIREEFNDNIFFTDTQRRSSLISTLSAGVGLLERSERGGASLSSRLDRLIYTGNGDLDGFEQRHVLQGSYLLSPLATVAADASFSHETRPDRYVEASGIVVRQESDHQRYSARAAVTLSERVAGELSYAYQKADYQSATASDVEGHGARGSLEYATMASLPALKLETAASFNRYRYDADLVRNYDVTAGAGCRIGETWSAKGGVGASFTRSQRRDEAGWLANLTVAYRGEHDDDRATLVVLRDLQSVPGRSGVVEVTSATVQYAGRVTSELTGALGAGWYRNRSHAASSDSSPVDQTSARLNPSVLYRLARGVDVELSYEYAWVRDRYEKNDVSRHKVLVSLTGQLFIAR